MTLARLVGGCLLLVVAGNACGKVAQDAASDTPGVDTSASADTGSATPDSIPEERPDSIVVSPPDSATMMLALLPAVPPADLTGDAAALGDRAVFVPRTQRWFMARTIDGALAMDIGRVDGGVGTSDAARAALSRMFTARSPVQPGMRFTLHTRGGSSSATVVALQLTGRRILARLDAPAPDSSQRAMPVEWRGDPAVALRVGNGAVCTAGDAPAIEAAIARVTATRELRRKKDARPGAPLLPDSVSVLRGCFGDFRALITIRPIEITPETVERVTLVRSSGTTRSGRLRDLSYPLHELVGVLDIDADGVQEIVVHSFRPAMETWSALRMTDSVSFTRFASGFTIERR